eukprot:1489427-Pleurochrysis_carterae.AAC.1
MPPAMRCSLAIARNPAAQLDDEGPRRLFEQVRGHHGGRLATAACDSFGHGAIVVGIVFSACDLQLRGRMIFVWRREFELVVAVQIHVMR